MGAENLLGQVAAHLAGRPVKVRWRDPVLSHALGSAYKTVDGQAVVDICPGLSDETALEIILHELAHVRLDWQDIQPANFHALPPGSQAFEAKTRQENRQHPREAAANHQAAKWLDFAERNAWRYDVVSLGDKTEMLLRALLDWQPEKA